MYYNLLVADTYTLYGFVVNSYNNFQEIKKYVSSKYLQVPG